MAANAQQIENAPYGTFGYGPSIDGGLVPRLPAVTMSDPSFNTSVRVLLGHNSNEGIVFVNQNAQDGPQSFVPNLRISLPSLKDGDVAYLNTTMYPPVDGTDSGPYKDEVMREAITSADVGIICNNYALAAYTTDAYMYEYGVFPGIHGADLGDTFYNGGTSNVAAGALQQWIASFVTTGSPSSTNGPVFPKYGAGQSILKLTASGKAPVAAKDDISGERCKVWFERLFPNL
jgi:carboxylesterase type B